MAAAKDISKYAAITSVLSELCGMFTLKGEHKNSTEGFPGWMDKILLYLQLSLATNLVKHHDA